MTKNEKDYSDYIKHMSNVTSGLSLLGGFAFTVITILLTQLPDLSSISSQLALFFLAAVFELTLFVVAMNVGEGIYLCRNVPPITKRTKISNLLIYLIFGLMGAAVVVMFLLWNLVYLGLASGIVWALLIIAFFLFVWKPFQEYRKTIS